MIFGRIAKAVGSVLNPVRDLIDNLHTSEEEKGKIRERLNQIEVEAREQIHEHVEAIVDAQKEVLLAELRGSRLQRNWRPILMLVIITIMANNYLVAPYVDAIWGVGVQLEFPAPFWNLLTVAVGGYIAGRTYEKSKGVSMGESREASQVAADRTKTLMNTNIKVKPVKPSEVKLRGPTGQ
jgi:hypothetical protein